MKLISCLSLLFVLLFTTCSKPQIDLITPPKSAQALLSVLENAYKEDDQSAFRAFFEEWKLRVVPQQPEDLPNDTVKVIHEIFKEFYTPRALGVLTSPLDWSKAISTNVVNVVVNNKVYFTISKETEEDNFITGYHFDESDSITDF